MADVTAGGAVGWPARVARWVGREVVHRRLPHGLIHWRYLWPRPPEPLARQRALWRSSVPRLPRPLWAALEAWLWLRWQLWSGPISILRAVRRLGPRVREEEAIGLLAQTRAVSAVALGFCVPPFEIYRHRLYLRENRGRVADLVFDHTAEAFRSRLDAPGAETRTSQRLLFDKERQTAELSELGVPMAPIRAVVRRASPARLERCLSDCEPVLFCKPRHGSASAGALTAWITAGILTVEPLDGVPLVGERAEAHWQRLLEKDDMLLQPKLSVHPDLAPAASDHDIVTARYITRRGLPNKYGEQEIAPYCAMLELPAGKDHATGRCRYVVLPVDASTGEIQRFPQRYLPDPAVERHRAAVSSLRDSAVSGWESVLKFSALAHRHFPGVHAIAWDWALTPSGPVLLEGNAGWGTATPQQLHGGLLAPPGSLAAIMLVAVK